MTVHAPALLPGAIEDEVFKVAEENLPALVIAGILVVLGILYAFARLGDAAQGAENFVRVVRGVPWFNPERRARRDRRRDLAEVLAGRLRQLSDNEQWASHGYTDLEVEVIPSTRRRSRLSGLLPYRSERRRGALGREIEKGRERRVVLKGEPGAGKSMALRHVAQELADKAQKARGATAVIPIYVNLKGFRPAADVPTLRELEYFVRGSLNPDNGDAINALLEKDEFAVARRQGAWLFLLDSFDELPAVLGATEEDTTIEDYSTVIDRFAEGHKCRVIVASRFFRAPEGLGNWATVEIAPLTERRRREFMENSEVLTQEAAEWLIEALATAHTDIVADSSNPLFLALLCEHARHERSLPDDPHAVFKAEITRRLQQDKVRKELRSRFGLEADELEANAALIAYTMSAHKLGLEPERGDLIDVVSAASGPVSAKVDATLDALEHVHLARGESAEQRQASQRRFTFSHRRFQEHFASRLVLDGASRVSVEDLIMDDQWRETTVTLCQTHEDTDEIVHAISEALDRAAAEMEARDPALGFAWPPKTRHVLGILQSGFGADPSRLPDATRNLVGRIADHVWTRAEQDDHALMFEIIGVAPEATRTRLLSEAFRSGSAVLGEVAYRQVARLTDVPAALGEEMRRALVGMAVSGRLREERRSIGAQIARLSDNWVLRRSLALLLRVRLVDAAIHLALAAAVVASSIIAGETAQVVIGLPLLGASYLAWPGMARSIATARIDIKQLNEATWGWVGPTAFAVGLRAYLGLLAWLLFQGVPSAGVSALAITWLLMLPLAVPVAVVRGEFLARASIAFAPLVLISSLRPAMTRKTLIVLAIAIPLLVAYIIGFSALMERVEFDSAPSWISVALPVLGLLVGLVMFASTTGHDWLWYLARWHRPQAGLLLPRDLLDALGHQNTTTGLLRVLRTVSREDLLDVKHDRAGPLLRDLQRATRAPNKDKVDPDELGLLTDEVRDWLIAGGKGRASLIAKAGPKLRDAIDPLLKDVRAETERRERFDRREVTHH